MQDTAAEDLPGEEQLEFLDALWGDKVGFVELEQRWKDRVTGVRSGDLSDTKSFKWPMERARIGRYIDARLEEELYFAVPKYNRPERRTSSVQGLKAVYVDDDGVTGQWHLEPSFWVESSPGHRHVYWVLDQEYDANEVSRVGFEISAFHRHDNQAHADMATHKHCGTDPGGWDLTQILRVPGTVNTKLEYGPDFRHRITVEGSGATYTLEQMATAYPKTDAPFVSNLTSDELPADIPSHVDLLAQLSGRTDLIDLFMNEPTGRGSSTGWDERLFALENALFRMGFDEKEVYALAWASACNKFKRGVRNADGITFSPRPNPQLDLWRDVLKAKQVHGHRETWQAPGYDRSSTQDGELQPYERTEDAQREFASAKPVLEIDLLSPEEYQRSIDKRTMIDAYVEWASSKTDASIVYHEAMAFTILSTIFGEYGHAFPKFGKLRLNMWFLVMGKTTRARKSTSRGLGLKVIDGVSTSIYKYDEGSDFTSEGLANRLLEKDKQSSLVHRDEVQGLFKEINNKNYMSGLNDFLTELYDGKVRGKLRATGSTKSSDSVETNFVLFLMGIVSKITSVLTLDDFQSGFLARFIHVIGEAPPRTRESEWLDQASPSQIAGGDPVYLELLRKLMMQRAAWAKRSPQRDTIPIVFEEDAWRRWNEANWELQEAVKEHERAEILEAAVDRMGKSAIKAAALLAMSEGRDRANLDDVLVALRYTGVWATHMVRSAEMVSESFFKKDLRTLHDLVITKGGTMKWEDAYSKMDKQPGEFKNVVEGAVLSNMIRVQVDEKTKTRYLEVV